MEIIDGVNIPDELMEAHNRENWSSSSGLEPPWRRQPIFRHTGSLPKNWLRRQAMKNLKERSRTS